MDKADDQSGTLSHSISQSLIAGARWPDRIMAFLRL